MSNPASGPGVRLRTRCALTCLAFFWLLPASRPALAALPLHLKSTEFDRVCVAPDALVPACETLAVHRRNQGLRAVVLPLDEVLLWSPYGDDRTASRRWLALTAVQQWGARYLMLAGPHAVLPAPLHRIGQSEFDFTSPTDAWFACLGGDWDRDGDGLVAEFTDDGADPTVQLAVGRLPLDDPDDVAAAVAKIIDFEQRRGHDLAFLQLEGAASAWQLNRMFLTNIRRFAPLACCGHLFLGAMLSGAVADSRQADRIELLLPGLLALPDGGPVTSAVMTTYWYQSVQGDPAMLIHSAGTSGTPPPPVSLRNARAVPNPFNPGTSIRFEVTGPVGSRQPVRVEIYDPRGRLVATLLDRELSPGPAEVDWRPSACSGLYLARIRVADRAATVKLVLAR